jgi:hypothetical protein
VLGFHETHISVLLPSYFPFGKYKTVVFDRHRSIAWLCRGLRLPHDVRLLAHTSNLDRLARRVRSAKILHQPEHFLLLRCSDQHWKRCADRTDTDSAALEAQLQRQEETVVVSSL